jgi:methionine aminotransferase
VQHAIAEFLADEKNYNDLHNFYQLKRDYFVSAIKGSRFEIIPCHGTYFQLVDYSRISEEDDMDFASRLIKEYGIGTIPVSPFYHKGDNNRVLRLCFAKKKDTLDKAAEILCKI